jgi:sulfopyruvate decarboxylase TPP-binding subunit
MLSTLETSGVWTCPAPREDVAVSVACGLTLGGSHPLVYLKNAGLLTCGDALLSLARDVGIGLFLLVGWAGSHDDRLPHHVVSGEVTQPYLDALGIPWNVASADHVDEIARVALQCRADQRHYALLVPPPAT